jgi:hypothetical protein
MTLDIPFYTANLGRRIQKSDPDLARISGGFRVV